MSCPFFPTDHLYQRLRQCQEKAILVTPLLQAVGRHASQLVQTGVDPSESIGLQCFVASEAFILHLPKLLPPGSLLLAQPVIRNKSVFIILMCYAEKGSNVQINIAIPSYNPCMSP